MTWSGGPRPLAGGTRQNRDLLAQQDVLRDPIVAIAADCAEQGHEEEQLLERHPEVMRPSGSQVPGPRLPPLQVCPVAFAITGLESHSDVTFRRPWSASFLIIALAFRAVDLGFGEAHVAAQGDPERASATGTDELAGRRSWRVSAEFFLPFRCCSLHLCHARPFLDER